MQRRFIWLFWIVLLGMGVFIADQYHSHQQNMRFATHSTQNAHYTQVTITATPNHHYIFNGAINGQSVRFLVDTGATSVSIPQHIADRLRLSQGRAYQVNTANGRVQVYQTHIDTLSIGDIKLHQVRAHINPNSHSSMILLGMSALRQLQLQQQGNQLILRQYH